ncbi:MAG: ATP-binding protein [Bacteroidota bacterium]
MINVPELSRQLLILLLGFCSLSIGTAQTLIIPETLTIEDGLSQGFIPVIHQDSEGFLWLGTKNGLNRYDGRAFKVFTRDPDDPYSISNDWIQAIREEGDFLVLGTHDQLLNVFHKQTQRCYRILLQAENMKAFSRVEDIFRDTLGNYWLNIREEDQVIRLSFPKDFWLNLPDDPTLVDSVQVEAIPNAVQFFVQGDRLFLTHQDQTAWVDIPTQSRQVVPTVLAHPERTGFTKITPFIGIGKTEDKFNKIFQLTVFKNGNWQEVNTDLRFNKQYYYDQSTGLLWLSEYGKDRLLVFDIAVLQQADQLSPSDASYHISNVSVVESWFKDNSGILWAGTNGFGIRRVSPRKLAVKTHVLGESISNKIYSSSPEELLYKRPDATKNYIGTGNLKSIFQYFKSSEINHIDILLDSIGKGWVAIHREAPQNENHQLELYTYEEGNLEFRKKMDIAEFWNGAQISLLSKNKEELYLLFSNHLIQYNPLTNEHRSFIFDPFPKSPTLLFYLAQTANGDCWIGSQSGLVHAKKTADGFDFSLVEGLRNPICASLLTDPNDANILWIGTKGGGLHRLDTRTMAFEYLHSKNGLPNDVIYSVLNDEQGNLWMSSNKGIISYHPETGKIRNFTAEDGMQSNEFNTHAFGKSPRGELLFGGINGLNVFHPDDLQENPFVPEVRITGLAVNNKEIGIQDSTGILSKAIDFTSAIRLPFQQNSINLTFAALEFTAPGKNTFRYYLEGAEAEWTHTTTENRASYLNIAPGSYTFKIKAANGDQVWSEQIRTLDITILPPWYRTTLAYLCYILLIVGAIWQYSRFQRNRWQLKHSLELEQKEAERLKELDTFRSRLFTNITHEFRTPLTVILGTSEQLENQNFVEQPAQKRLSLIRRNGQNLLKLVNQMLDLSKIEHNQLQINYQQGDLLAYLRYLTESFSSLATAEGITLAVESGHTEVWMDYDEEKMRQIISNLLSNAIKYTPSGGEVVLRANQQSDQLYVSVEDTGKGIAKEDLPHIFNRYYQANDDMAKAGGTGIGLALTYELVKLLGGNIEVTSEVEQGTTFTFWLPVRHEAPFQQNSPTSKEGSHLSEPTTPIQKQALVENAPKLLIVEDNRDVVDYLTTCLQENYQLAFAYDGQSGIEQAIELTPDIIISDVMMPHKTGLELTDALKNDERTSHIPIVLLTAKADMVSRLAGLRKGADVYLAKPFYQEELLVHLENLLKIRQQLQAKYQQLALSTTTETPDADDQEAIFLHKLRQLLETNLDNTNLTAQDIARQIGMSRTNLYLKLNAVAGMTFNIYLRTLRLQKAKVLLQTTTLTIAEVAYEVGFSSPSYFSNQFKKQFGHSPSEERAKYKR